MNWWSRTDNPIAPSIFSSSSKILPGEDLALDVFIAPRHIADDHHLGLRIAVGKAQIAGGLFQREIFEAQQRRLKLTPANCRRLPMKGRPSGRCKPVLTGAATTGGATTAAKRLTGASPTISSAPISMSQASAAWASPGLMSFCFVCMSELVILSAGSSHYNRRYPETHAL